MRGREWIGYHDRVLPAAQHPTTGSRRRAFTGVPLRRVASSVRPGTLSFGVGALATRTNHSSERTALALQDG
jgi:hypothetical protein